MVSDFYGTIVAEGEEKGARYQDIRIDDVRFPLTDRKTKIWRAYGRLACVNGEIGDRVVVQFCEYPNIRWGVWKAKAIARPPAANQDRKEVS